MVHFIGAEDRNRTGTRGKSRRILSPVRLPVPPRRHMDGGGFEPPKHVAADLQSVPFGHSGIHPNISLTVINYIILLKKMQGFF